MTVSGVGCRLDYNLLECGTEEITSPNYPSYYDNNADCQWILRSETGNTLTVLITSFQTESTYDRVEIGNGEAVTTESVIGDYAGVLNTTVPIEVTSTDPALWITFVSDDDKTQQGFVLTVKDNCPTSKSGHQTTSALYARKQNRQNLSHSRNWFIFSKFVVCLMPTVTKLHR